MDIDAILGTIIAARAGDSTSWLTDELREWSAKSGTWSLAKKDCDTSRLPDDSAPGDSLSSWVGSYASHGHPFDQVRIRYRHKKTDRSWFVSVHHDEKTGWDRTLDVLLPLLADDKARTVIAATIGRALRPVVREAIQPIVKTAVVETLSDLLEGDAHESEQQRDVSGSGADLAGGH